MKLYEVNQQIEELLDRLEFDPETGEIGEDTDEILMELDALQMERTRILEYVAKVTLNTRAEAAALKEEEERLKKRRLSLQKKEEHLLYILDRECVGEKTDLGVATVSYRKSESVAVNDAKAAIAWLKDNEYEACIRTPAPEVRKDEVKKLLKNGVVVPGTAIVTANNCSLR